MTKPKKTVTPARSTRRSKRPPAKRTKPTLASSTPTLDIGEGVIWFDAGDGYQLAIDNQSQLIVRKGRTRLASLPRALKTHPLVAELTGGLAELASLPGPVRAPRNVENLAVDFVNRLATGQYAAARAMTSPTYQAGMTTAAIRARFERLLEADDGEFVGPIRMVRSDMLDSGAASVYVSIGGENGEAVAVDIDREGDELRVIGVQWGRP